MKIVPDFFILKWSKFYLHRRVRVVFLGLLLFLLSLVTSCEFHSPTISNMNWMKTAPNYPKRVVVLAPILLENTLALGITPVGAPKASSYYLHLSPKLLQNIEETGDASLPTNLETILSLKPDLILGSIYQQEIYPLLSQIAPTILFDTLAGAGVQRGDWEKFFYQVADALAEKQKAIQIMADYKNHLAQVKACINSRLSSVQVSIIETHLIELITLYTANFFGGSILEAVGLSRPPSQTLEASTTIKLSGFKGAYLVSWESLNKVDGDVMFVMDKIAGVHNSLAQLQTQPLWSRLKVVQQGRVYPVGFYWLGFSPMSANRVLDDLEKYIIERYPS
jgi:iron complex transport system substrate-binding protein